MVDNLKKKKADGKRIALGQKHERSYLKRIAKTQLKRLEKQDGNIVWGYGDRPKGCSKASIIRCLKSLIKYLERDKR